MSVEDARELPAAIRNPFTFTGTQHVATAHLSLAEQWEIERQKRLVEHDRDRSLWIAEGARLGPITYSETRGDVWGDWHGEWRSVIEDQAHAILNETLDEFMERTKETGISTSLRRMVYARRVSPRPRP